MHPSRVRIAWLVAVTVVTAIHAAAAQSENDSPRVPEQGAREATEVRLNFKEQTWFTDVVGTAVIEFPEPVDLPDDSSAHDDDIALLEFDVTPSQAVVRFLPRKPGLAVFPSLEFQSKTNIYRTPPTQLMVSVPRRSSEMRFETEPRKTTVYVGEPLRVDVSWASRKTANRFRSLHCFPKVFNDENVEIVIPRCTAPEQQQMGLPFGGRRIIATRKRDESDPTLLGTVRFPLYLKFKKAGKFEIPATRLECALLTGKADALAPYAAYFNNGLFDPFSSLKAYERVFVESSPMSIDVLPLPVKGRSELFSDLFAPCSVDVSISTSALSVGQVLEVDLRVHSDAPHGMLDLQPLGRQPSLRGRFQVYGEYGRTWYRDGTGFRARVRPLTTNITAFPSLRIQYFDPDIGAFRALQTTPIPVRISPHQGRDYFDLRSLSSEPTITDQPEGIWENATPGNMSKFLNHTTAILAEHVFWWILGGAMVFGLLLPWVRERRRRANDAVYCAQTRVYRQLLRCPEGTPQKWEAFLRFLATGFSMPAGAWTVGDTRRRLRSLDLSEQDLELIADTHAATDRAVFSSQHPTPEIPQLNGVARRIFTRLRRNAGLSLIALVMSAPVVGASDWDQATSLFDRALKAAPGLPETESLFTQAALMFENAAHSTPDRGGAWYNAGNAWFKAGQLGRAIACYRHAQIDRPFDRKVRENLGAARALTVDVLDDGRTSRVQSWPVRWICAAIVPAWWLFLTLCLVHIRFRTSATLAGCGATAVVIAGLALTGFYAGRFSGRDGVVTVREVYGRKGPAYAYNTAFNEPLHDGLEFRVKSQRSDWLKIELSDGRQCWIPSGQTRLISNRRL